MCDRHQNTHVYVHRVGYTHDPADSNHHIHPDSHESGCYFYYRPSDPDIKSDEHAHPHDDQHDD